MAVYEEYITGDDADVTVKDATWVAQTFTPSKSHQIIGVNLYFSSTKNTDVGNIDVSIRATSGGLPTGSDLVSGTLDSESINAIAGNDRFMEISFGAGYYLVANTAYAIVVRAVNTVHASDNLIWRCDTSSPTYSGGSRIDSSDSGGSWAADTSGDFLFQERDGYVLKDYYQGGGTGNSPVNGATWKAETFNASESYTSYGLALKGARTGSPGTLTISIRAVDGNNKPTGSDLASGTYDADTLASSSTVFSWFDIIFSSPVALTSGTEYAIVARATAGDGSNKFNWAASGNTYVGTNSDSSDSGSSWTVNSGADNYFKTYAGAISVPATDLVSNTRLVAAANNEAWYESASGTMSRLDASIGKLDTGNSISITSAFGKAFIANGTNLKVVDFQNTKIVTSSVGSHPPDPGTELTGGTSTATMIVDYITALSGACTIYGFRTTTATFSASETVTGTDDDGNAISFAMTSAAEVAPSPPHWYDYTVFGQSTTFGAMPADADVVKTYRGRILLTKEGKEPHQWHLGRVAGPFNFLYTANDPLSAVAGQNADAGQIGDNVIAAIPYGDDFVVFGCSDSIYLLDGDPVSGGSLDILDDSTGIYGTQSWVVDGSRNLYFFGKGGVYKMAGGRSKPINISQDALPKLVSVWALDPTLHRVILSYDRIRNGIVISKTTLADGTNLNYYYDLRLEAFFPETYPTACGIFSSFDYGSVDPTYSGLVLGCQDGYLRDFYDADKDDDAGATDSAISSYVVLGPVRIGVDDYREGKAINFLFELSGGASGGSYTDSDGATYEIHTANDAETVIEDIKDGATAVWTGTISAPGRQNRILDRARGIWMAVKILNTTASESWSLNKVSYQLRGAGRT